MTEVILILDKNGKILDSKPRGIKVDLDSIKALEKIDDGELIRIRTEL